MRGKGDRFPQMAQIADPGHHSFNSHPKTGVRDRPVFAQVQVPLERLDRKVVLLEALHQQIVVMDALPAADDLPVALGRKNIDAQGNFRPLRIRLHIKRFHLGRIAVDHDRRRVLLRQDCFVPAAEIASPLDFRSGSLHLLHRFVVAQPWERPGDLLQDAKYCAPALPVELCAASEPARG